MPFHPDPFRRRQIAACQDQRTPDQSQSPKPQIPSDSGMGIGFTAQHQNLAIRGQHPAQKTPDRCETSERSHCTQANIPCHNLPPCYSLCRGAAPCELFLFYYTTAKKKSLFLHFPRHPREMPGILRYPSLQSEILHNSAKNHAAELYISAKFPSHFFTICSLNLLVKSGIIFWNNCGGSMPK